MKLILVILWGKYLLRHLSFTVSSPNQRTFWMMIMDYTENGELSYEYSVLKLDIKHDNKTQTLGLVQFIKKDPDEIDSDCNMEEAAPIPVEFLRIEPKLEVSMETGENPKEDDVYFESAVMKQDMIRFREEDAFECPEFPDRPGTTEMCKQNGKKELGGLDAENPEFIEIKTEQIYVKEEDVAVTDKFPGEEAELEIALPGTYPQTEIILEQGSSNSSSQNWTEEWHSSAQSKQQVNCTTAYPFCQLTDLKLHGQVVSKHTPCSSSQWDKLFSHESNLKGNKNCHKPFTCNECGKTFSHKSTLKDHMNIHSGSFSCNECGKLFASQSNLKTHMDIHSGHKPFSCNECTKLFSRKSHLKDHMNIHYGHKPFSCSECGKLFSQKGSYRIHMKTHFGDQPFSCSECGKLFSNQNHLKSHMNIHSVHKPFSCKVCSKSFTRKGDLNVHMYTHDDDKPFFCNECGKLFSRKYQLRDHINIHFGRKPFSCKVCSRSFTRKADLNVHMNIHSGLKPFLCNECGKSFSRKSQLKDHINMHLGHKPFSCKECGRLFSRQSHLTVHMKIHRVDKPSS